MREQMIAARYAKALTLCAKDDNERQQIEKDLSRLSDVISASSDFKVLLTNPAFHPEERLKVVSQLLSQEQISQPVGRVFELLVRRNRPMLMPMVASAYSDEMDRHFGRVKANVASAQDVSETELHQLSELLKGRLGKSVVASASMDPSLLGGYRVKIGGLVFDGSLKSMLQRLQREMIDAHVVQ